MVRKNVMTPLLDAVSDPVRRQIVFLLKHRAPLNVGEIAGQFRISRPAVSHHLKVLKDAKMVQSEKRGQEVYYRLDIERMVAALRTLADRLEQFASDEPPSL